MKLEEYIKLNLIEQKAEELQIILEKSIEKAIDQIK